MTIKQGKKVVMLSVSNDALSKLKDAGISIEYHFPYRFLWCNLSNMDILYSTNVSPTIEGTITVDQLLQLRMLPCYDSRYTLYKEFLNEHEQ